MQHLILTIVLVFSSIAMLFAQENDTNKKGTIVTVSVVNALNDKGAIKFAFYTKENFRMKPLFAKSAHIKNGKSTVTFSNVPEGEYAIISYHDENNNGRMDFFENGMPKESYGTSNNPMNFGPPTFESSKFKVADKNLSLEIKF